MMEKRWGHRVVFQYSDVEVGPVVQDELVCSQIESTVLLLCYRLARIRRQHLTEWLHSTIMRRSYASVC